MVNKSSFANKQQKTRTELYLFFRYHHNLALKSVKPTWQTRERRTLLLSASETGDLEKQKSKLTLFIVVCMRPS